MVTPAGRHLQSLLLICGALSISEAGAAQAPKIGKPITVAPTPIAPLPPAVIDNSLAIGGEDIKARKVESRLTVEVHINGRPFQFLVDSGADTSVVGMRIVRDLQMPLGTPATLHGVTASARVDRVRVGELKIGGAIFRDLELPALHEADLGGAGMIGIDALVEQRLMLDFEKRVIKVEDARKPARMLDGEIVVTARRRRGQLILTQVKAVGLPIEAVVDTGSQITIGNLALREKLVRGNRKKLTTIEVTGVTGVTIQMQVARISELKLGSITLRDVPIAFADVPPFTVFGLNKEPALLLGTDLMETFRRVSLDFRRRKVRFQLRRCESSGISARIITTSSLMRISSGGDDVVCKR
jgi:predicted aspartyl protease